MQGVGSRVQGAGCRDQGAGCRVQGAGCRVQGVRFGLEGYPDSGMRIISSATFLLGVGVRATLALDCFIMT